MNEDYMNFDFNSLVNSFSQGNNLLQGNSSAGGMGFEGFTNDFGVGKALDASKNGFTATGSSPANGSIMDNMFGQNGWGMPALQSILGLGSLLQSNKALGMQERSLNTNIDALKTNLANQSKLVNQRMRQNQAEINKYNPDQAQDIDQYMRKWGVSGELGETGNSAESAQPTSVPNKRMNG